jgi:hypothetical protein
MEKIKLNAEVWEKVFASSLYQQTKKLFVQIFKRSIGFADFDAMSITREEWERIRGPRGMIFPFCELLWETKEGRRRCLGKQIFARLSTTLKPDICTCYAGLIEVIIKENVLKDVEGNTSLKEQMEELERRCIIEALQKSGYNKALCARMLGLKRNDLYRKMKRLRIQS